MADEPLTMTNDEAHDYLLSLVNAMPDPPDHVARLGAAVRAIRAKAIVDAKEWFGLDERATPASDELRDEELAERMEAAPGPERAALIAEWNARVDRAAMPVRDVIAETAWFLFNLGYPYDTTVHDSDGDPVTPPLPVLDALIEEWREHEVRPDNDETRDDYRASFAIEIGRDPWEAVPSHATEERT